MVTPGRAFLRRLIDLTAGVTRPHHHIRFNTEAKNDIRMWLQFLDNFNGRAFFLSERWATSSTLELYTDAAASKGYGAIFGKHWFYGPFPIAWHSLNISFLELFPITLAVHIWGATMANSCVLFFTDNAALVDIINKQTSKHKQVMILIRDLVLSCLKYNILFRATILDKINGKPRPPLPHKSRMEKWRVFALRAPSFLIWGDGGLLFHFTSSKIESWTK